MRERSRSRSTERGNEAEKWSKVSIIILNWNGWQDTLECLDSLSQIDYPNYEVVVIDNGSTDGSVARIREHFPELAIIEIQENLGYAAGNNMGIKYALDRGANYALILNNDTIVRSDFLFHLVAETEAANAALASPVVFSEKGDQIEYEGSAFNRLSCRGQPLHGNFGARRSWETQIAAGCCLLLSKDFLSQHGWLDERFFFYGEEVELSLRARRKGFKVLVVGNAIIYHKRGRSIQRAGSPTAIYYDTRNRILLAEEVLNTVERAIFNVGFIVTRLARFFDLLAKGNASLFDAYLRGMWDGWRGKYGKSSRFSH